MKENIEIGDLVRLTGDGWHDYDDRLENKIVLIICMWGSSPVFINADGDRDSIVNDEERPMGCIDFGATIVSKAKRQA